MNRLFTVAVPVLLLASCVAKVEEDNVVGTPKYTTFHATIEGNEPESKVYADENMKVLWNADDRITVFNQLTYNSQFRFAGEDGDNAGDFELIPPVGLVTGNSLDNIYAVYPYASGSGNKINNSGNTITLSLPAEQQYKADSFGIGANTMIAVTDNSFLAFKNVGGYLSLRLYGDNVSVSRVTIQGNNHEKIAGKANISVGVGVLPSVSMTEEATEEVSIVCEPAVTIGTSKENYTEFWFVLPPTTFTGGFTITVTDELGGVFQKTTSKSLTVSRSTIEWMSALNVVPNYDNLNVVFADANFKAYCVENFDANDDGEISRGEAKAITEIDVRTDDIESLGGIEYMTNLEYLLCHGSSTSSGLLTTLDVTNNTNLVLLICDDNHISSLDVSNNSELTELSCGRNELTSLDVSNNIALTQLSCYENQLTTLDVTNNTALTSLSISENQLVSLDISNNTALTWLSCFGNQLTTLNVNNNTSLTSLNCYNNQLTTLDVSNNTALTRLWCGGNQLTSLDVTNNTALESLSCRYNQLTTLDVSNNTALTQLYCDTNQLTTLDVSNNTALKLLWCGQNQLSSLDVSNNTDLSHLSCISNPSLTEIWLGQGQSIGTLTYDTGVATLKYCVSFADANFKAYCVSNFDSNSDGRISVEEASTVETINVCTDNITSLGGIEAFSNLVSLYARGSAARGGIYFVGDLSLLPNQASGTSRASGQLTCVDVSDFIKLQTIDISHNNTIIEFKTDNCLSLQNIYCRFCNITELDVSDNIALRRLNCGINQLTSLDVSKNSALTSLNCEFNQLITLDVSNNTALTEFSCYTNQLTSLDIRYNTALTNLHCSVNQLTSLDVGNNTGLIKLDCVNNKITSLDVSNNSALASLECGYNQLASLDVSNNTALTSLKCFVNSLTTLDVSNNTALTELWCESNSLTTLDVSNNTALTTLRCSSNSLTTLDVSNNTALGYLYCKENPNLEELWLKTGQVISGLFYDSLVTTIKYKD